MLSLFKFLEGRKSLLHLKFIFTNFKTLFFHAAKISINHSMKYQSKSTKIDSFKQKKCNVTALEMSFYIVMPTGEGVYIYHMAGTDGQAYQNVH